MPFLIHGTDRQTDRPTRFLSNAASELLAQKSADALGVDVASIEPLPERAPDSNSPLDENVPDLVPPTVRWSGEWRTIEQPNSPAVRWIGLVGAIVGLAALAYFANDMSYARKARDAAAADLAVLHRSIQSPYEMTFPNNRTRDANDSTAYAAETTRMRIDGVLALIGGVALTGGLSLFKAHRNKSGDAG